MTLEKAKRCPQVQTPGRNGTDMYNVIICRQHISFGNRNRSNAAKNVVEVFIVFEVQILKNKILTRAALGELLTVKKSCFLGLFFLKFLNGSIFFPTKVVYI